MSNNRRVTEFILEGKPVAKQSMKLNVKTKTRYKDPKVKTYEKYVRGIAELSMIGKEMLGKDAPCSVAIIVYVKRSEKDKAYYPITKPDLDNVSKGILDSLNKIVYYDDKQVVDLTVSRLFSTRDCVEVKIWSR